MAFLKYSDLPIFANFSNEGIAPSVSNASHMFAATEASLNMDANLSINRFLGGMKPEMMPQGALQGKFSMTFYPMVEYTEGTSLNLSRSNQLKFFETTGDFKAGHQINISNYVLKRCFLDSYSIKVNPYQPVLVTANFTVYDITDLKNKTLVSTRSFDLAKMNKPNYESFHGLTTRIFSVVTEDNLYIPESKTSLDINVSCQRVPIYTLGNSQVDSVHLTTVERDTVIQGEGINTVIDFSGKHTASFKVSFSPLSRLNSLNYDPAIAGASYSFGIDGRILSQQLSVSQNSVLSARVAIKEAIR